MAKVLLAMSNKGWAGGSGRSSFKIHVLDRDWVLPQQADLNTLWQGTPAAFGYLAVIEHRPLEALITLPPSTGPKLRERFVLRLENFLKEKR